MALTLIGYVGQGLRGRRTTEVKGRTYPVSVIQEDGGVGHVYCGDPLLQYVSS